MNIVSRFILIVSAILVATLLGYLARKKNWLAESLANPLMFYTVIFGWTPTSAAVLWQLPLVRSLVALPLISALVPILLVPFGVLLARYHRLDSKSAGTFIVASGISNIGFTMGGFVCYCLFGMPGLGYANLFASSWAIPYVLFFYPLARRYGDPSARLTPGFLLRTFFDASSLPILGSLVGLALNLLAVPMPQFLITHHVIDALVIFTILFSFAIVGLQIHFHHLSQKIALHFSLAAVKFLITPLLTALALILLEILFGHLPPIAKKVVYIQAFMPTAIFTVIITNLFDLDPRLATMLFLVNTAAFLALILPLLAFFLS